MAVLVLVGLAGSIGWWIVQGGLSARVVEIDRVEPQNIAFEVDINAAPWPELAQLPGVGQTLAKRIVDVRDQNGPFRDHEDLRRVRGIGPKTLDKLRPYLRPMANSSSMAGR